MSPKRDGMKGAGLLVLAIAAGQAGAQPPDEQRVDEATLFRDIPTVVGASKFEQRTQDAPSSVSIVTAREIQAYGYRTLGDVLAGVRGFTVASDRNYSYVGVRGFSRTGDYNSRILLLIDGRRVNDNIYDDAGFAQDALIDVAVIDRVEVVRGPSSSLYGASAFFAVVNVITKRGRDLDGLEAGLGAGSLRSGEARLSYGKRLDTGLEVMVSASGYGSRGNTRLSYPEFNSPATNFGVAENADGERAGRFFTKLRYGHFTLEAAGVARDKQVPTASFGTVFNDNRLRTRDERAFVELRYENEISASTESRGRVSYNRVYYHGDYPFATGAATVLNKDYSRGDWWTAEWLLTSRWRADHRLTVGAEYQDNLRIEQGNYDVATYLDDRRRGSIAGVYAQDEWRLSRNTILNAGIRFDQFTTFGSTVNPRLALILRPGSDTVVKLLAGSAFRAPNAYELYYNDGNATQRANPDLRPERIATYEAVVEERLNSHWRAVGGVYHYRIKDLISQVIEPGTGLLVFNNVESVRAQGVEFELEGRTRSGAELRIGVTGQDTTDVLRDSRLPGSPRMIAKLNVMLPVAREATAGFETRYVSSQQSMAGNTIPAYFVSDLTLRLRTPIRSTRASLSLYNLFNRRYADPAGREHVQDRIPQDGRMVWLRLEHGF